VPDLGRNTTGDATALHARGTQDAQTAAAETAAGLPQPTAGRKEYTDAEGKVTQIVEWFGYKLHLLVDARHEVAVAYKTTSANASDGANVPALVAQAQAVPPEGRIETLAYQGKVECPLFFPRAVAGSQACRTATRRVAWIPMRTRHSLA